ncbi:MAG: DUF4214 domain-containing protein [Acidimicrobiales bacterium]
MPTSPLRHQRTARREEQARRRPWFGAVGVIVALLMVGLVPAAGANPAQEDSLIERRSVPSIVETIDGESPEHPVPELHRPARSIGGDERDRARSNGPTRGRRIDGTMTTTYEAATPRRVREVVDAAVAAWDEALTLSPTAPLEISVLWTDLGPRLLGQAGTEGEYRDAEQFPTDRWYPAALANQLANFDINGAATPEIMVELNSQLGQDWYIGTQGNPAFGQIDLYSVVLHEIAHGLGFLGSATASRTGTVRLDHSPPSIYDDFVVNADGTRLVELDRAAALDALTSGELRFDIGFGRSMPLSAPDRFVNGSSYSHFDESIPETEPGAMMTPALKNGETQRTIDAAVLGVLDQVGWDLDTQLVQPSIIDIQVSSGEFEMVWSEDLSKASTLSAEYEVTVKPLTSSGTTPPEVRRVVEPARSGAVRVAALQNGTTYEVSIKGTRPSHPPGPPARTSILLPPNPNQVGDLTTTKAQGVTLTWLPPIPSGEPVTGYEIEYRTDSSPTWIRGTAKGTTWSTALEDGRYWFRVRGVNRIGGGLWNETGLVGLAQGPVRPMPLDGQIGRLYEAYFDRTADQEGMVYWRQIRAAGIPLDIVAQSFAQSDEFRARYGRVSDELFVRRLYRNVLDRAPDPKGNEYWLGQLADGSSRGSVVLGFSESPEFIRKTGTSAPQSPADGAIERLHIGLLRRTPTPTQLSALRRGRASLGVSALAGVAAELRGTAEFEGLWNTADAHQLLERIAASVVQNDDLTAGLVGRLRAGESLDELLVELTQTPSFVVATGTAP